jgi:hypothetical protein
MIIDFELKLDGQVKSVTFKAASEEDQELLNSFHRVVNNKQGIFKFGIDCENTVEFKNDSAAPEGEDARPSPQFPGEDSTTAKTMADLITPKQLVAVRAIANSKGVSPEAECLALLKCRPEELNKRAASRFIDHLKSTAPEDMLSHKSRRERFAEFEGGRVIKHSSSE